VQKMKSDLHVQSNCCTGLCLLLLLQLLVAAVLLLLFLLLLQLLLLLPQLQNLAGLAKKKDSDAILKRYLVKLASLSFKTHDDSSDEYEEADDAEVDP